MDKTLDIDLAKAKVRVKLTLEASVEMPGMRPASVPSMIETEAVLSLSAAETLFGELARALESVPK